MEERLQKLIAKAGIASRREAEELIRTQQVTVNGKIAHLGDKADPDVDTIRVMGKALTFKEKLRYIALYKKRGIVSSTESQADRPTVLDMIKVPERVYPVGRLDIDSDGLVLLTNDGDLTYRVTHPRFGCEKTYKVQVQGKLSREKLEQWRGGLVLEDDGTHTHPCKITVISGKDEANTMLQIMMHEGKKRQIRRIAEQLGHPVVRLTRLQIGPVTLGNLKPGEYRDLTPNEVKALKDSTQPKKVGKLKNERPYRSHRDSKR